MNINLIFRSLMIIALSAISLADTIILKDGRIIEGIIKKETEEKITIEHKGSEITLQHSLIHEIKKTTGETNSIHKGDVLFKMRKYKEAIDAYKSAIDEVPENGRIKIDLVKKAWQGEIEKQYDGIPLDETVKRLEMELKKNTKDDILTSILEDFLMKILRKQVNEAMDQVDYPKCVEYLEKAWEINPDEPGLALEFSKSLQK